MNKEIKSASGVILAGGLSTRIGRDKGGLRIGGRSQWLRSVDQMRRLFSEVVYVTNDLDFVPPDHDLVVANDEIPHLGPLGGILAGIKAAKQDRVFVVAYDMPFIDPGLIRFLVDYDPSADVTVPVVGGKYEPLHAVYGPGCVPAIAAQLAAGTRKVIEFYQFVTVREVGEEALRQIDPDLRSFFNINTWDDVHLAKTLAKEEQE